MAPRSERRVPSLGAVDLTAAREGAESLDAADPLRHVRERFAVPEGVIYLDGNSLGVLPVAVPEAVREVVEGQWGRDHVTSWNVHGWWDAPRRVGARLARLVGADEDEVVVADSTSVNLFKVLVAAARLRPDRRTLVIEPGNFPSDLYIADAVAELLDLRVVRAEPADVEALLAQEGADVAVVAFSHVDYRTGRAHDVASVTRAVQRAGAVAVWDLSHSAGALDVRLGEWGVDFAVGCTYKYLNGGPGAPAYVMAARRHLASMRSPLPGWTGHARPFAMEQSYAAGAGIDAMRCGTPPMLSLLAVEAALTAFDGLAMAEVRARSLSLTGLFLSLAPVWEPLGFRVVTPLAEAERGSQVSLSHPKAYGVVQALIARGVVGDFRAPDVLRLGFAPLYVRHVDVVDAVAHLVAVVEAGEQRDPSYEAYSTVT